MRNSHPASWSDDELLAHSKLSFSRASGPGGQNRNKVETSVQVEFLPAKIIAQASERRTQNENRKIALQRLRCKLAVDFRVLPIVGTAPVADATSLWRRYCVNGRINVSESNADWPAILAELMDSLSSHGWNINSAAESLSTSSSQLVKLLKKHSPAFSRLNEERIKQGQRPLV